MSEGIHIPVGIDERNPGALAKLARGLDDVGNHAAGAERKFGGAFGGIRSHIDRVAGAFNKLNMVMGPIMATAGFAGISAGLFSVGRAGMQTAAQLETVAIQYGVLYQSAERAQRRMAEVVQFAAKTPFRLGEVADAQRLIDTFGIKATNALTLVGDAAAAAQRPITEVAMTFGRIQSGAFGEAFMRLAEMGIATRKMLEGEGLKFDKQGSYQGSADAAMAAVARIVERRFSGMMEEMSKTWSGKMSTLQDSFALMMGGIMTPVMEKLKPKLDELIAMFDSVLSSGRAKALGEALADALMRVIDAIVNSIKWWQQYGETVKTVTGVAATAIATFVAVQGAAAALAYGVGTAMFALKYHIVLTFTSLQTFLATNWVALVIAGVVTALALIVKHVGGINVALEYMKAYWTVAFEHVKAGIEVLELWFVELGAAISDIFRGIASNIGTIMLAAATGNWALLGTAFAEGGRQMGRRFGDAYKAEVDLILGAAAFRSENAMDAARMARIGGGTIEYGYTAPAAAAGEAAGGSAGGLEEVSSAAAVGAPARRRAGGRRGGGESGIRRLNEEAKAEWFKLNAFYIETMEKLEGAVVGAWDAMIESSLSKGKVLQDTFKALGLGILKIITDAVGKMVTRWVFGGLKMLAASFGFETKATAASVAGSAARAAAAQPEIQADNAKAAAATKAAAAKTFEAHSWIPFVGIAMAAAMVAMMIASLAGLGKHRSGIVPGAGSGSEDNRLALLSAGEAVIPRASVQKYGRGMMEDIRSGTWDGGSGGSGGGDVHLHFHGNDSRGSRSRMVDIVETEIIPILNRASGKGRLKLAGGRA